MGLPLIITLIAIVSFTVTYALVRPSIRIAKRLGAVDLPDARRVHTQPTTRMGGIALFFGICIPLAITYVLCNLGVLPIELHPPENINVMGVFAGMLIMFAVGCVDDAFQIRPRYKLVGQIVASIVIVASGVMLTHIKMLNGSDFIQFGFLAWPITVFWLVAFANIINLVDGLDGLAAGVCGITYTAFFILSLMTSSYFTALIAIVAVAACLAFLRFNFHPAQLFMGDCGSNTLGLLLGVVSLLGVMKVASFTSLAVPIIIAGIPVLDTFSAIIRRKREHLSISAPDKGHIHHSLLQSGLDQRHVVLTIYAICGVFAVSGIAVAGSIDIVRIVIVIIDLAVAGYLVWKLKLFGVVLAHYYATSERTRSHKPVPTEFDGVMPPRTRSTSSRPASRATRMQKAQQAAEREIHESQKGE